VKLRDADFTTRQASRTLADAVQSDRAVYAVARGFVDAAPRRPARSRAPARVALSQLVAQGGEGQLSLLESSRPDLETERDRVISRMIDEVREKFGPDALGRVAPSSASYMAPSADAALFTATGFTKAGPHIAPSRAHACYGRNVDLRRTQARQDVGQCSHSVVPVDQEAVSASTT